MSSRHEEYCPECLRVCELHGNLYCPTCHKHDGECEYGNCEEDATYRIDHPLEVRFFCEHHALDPYYQFARAGCSVYRLE